MECVDGWGVGGLGEQRPIRHGTGVSLKCSAESKQQVSGNRSGSRRDREGKSSASLEVRALSEGTVLGHRGELLGQDWLPHALS